MLNKSKPLEALDVQDTWARKVILHFGPSLGWGWVPHHYIVYGRMLV